MLGIILCFSDFDASPGVGIFILLGGCSGRQYLESVLGVYSLLEIPVLTIFLFDSVSF